MTLSGSLSAAQFRELAVQMLATAENGIPEVVVNTQGVEPPVAELAGVLHRCAELLSWSGGALIVTSPSERLARRLHALGDSEDLVLIA
jgi:anti-anti-sigma regulatory factor